MTACYVCLTVDTETSIGGAFARPYLRPVGSKQRIYGQIGDKQYGIPLLMDIADRYGLRLTFFLEVLNKYFFGPGEVQQVCADILSQGHDVQLHVHPNYLNFQLDQYIPPRFSDLIGSYELEKQLEIIAEAKEFLTQIKGSPPLAFRAGCYGADLNTLQALCSLGFLIDSSYNQSFLPDSCLLPDWQLNTVSRQQGIFELPITNFVERSGLRAARLMPLDLNAVGFEELRFILQNHGADLGLVTIILHSFSFVRAFDAQYQRVRPRFEVIRRFKRLCAFLAEHANRFKVVTMAELTKEVLAPLATQAQGSFFPVVPAHWSVLRFAEQLLDRLPL